MAALASVIADTGDVERARLLDERALAGLRDRVGSEHPHTLACAANLAIDLRAQGEIERSRVLSAKTMALYRTALPAGHFELIDAAEGKRIAIDLDAPHL
jgi:hypothetical protein